MTSLQESPNTHRNSGGAAMATFMVQMTKYAGTQSCVPQARHGNIGEVPMISAYFNRAPQFGQMSLFIGLFYYVI
jgi:hypothetical protein